MSSKRPGDNGLTLGAKGRLSNQEMETLRNKIDWKPGYVCDDINTVVDSQLAQAVAYDHVPLDAKRTERQAKALVATKPMTKLYRKVASDPAADHHLRPGKKTLASIQYERKFIEKSFDSLKIAPPTRGISVAAKTVLQDEYVTRPRHVSSVSVNLSASLEDSEGLNNSKSGKRLAPTLIPQVFIL